MIAVGVAAALSGCNGDSIGLTLGTAQGEKPQGKSASAVTATGSATLTWTAPTQNVDGSPLTNLAGYEVRYGQSAAALKQTIDIRNPGTTTVRIDRLSAGTWYFTVAAYTNVGVESAPSVAASKTI